METFRQDIRFGSRMLWKSPGFTATVILTLALGIGANTAIFSVVNAFLFRPLPVRHADQLTVVAIQAGGQSFPAEISYPDYQEYRRQSDAFADLGGYAISLVGLGSGGHADRVISSFVTSNYFSMLGIRPAVGRLIAPGEGDQPRTGPVVVLGNRYWKQRFGGDPNVVGRSVSVNGQPVTIIGVVPPEFQGAFTIVEMDAYFPVGLVAINPGGLAFFSDRSRRNFHVLGMLKPGISAKSAESSLAVIAQRLAREYPQDDQGQIVRVYPEKLARPTPSAGRSIPLAAIAFLVLVGLVLLVACVNVANLLLARAAARQKEMAIRVAMGAGRARLIRQLLTESILLSLGGGLGGALLGNWACRALESIRPLGNFPARFNLAFDWRVFSYIAAVALLTGIMAGLMPALRASRVDLNDTLRESGRGLIGDGRRHPIRNILVIAQVAGSLILLVAAGLFTRSLARAQGIDLGFDPHNVLTIGVDPGLAGYDQPRAEAYFRELLRRAKSTPGVESASLAFTVPLNYYSTSAQVYAEGQGGAPRLKAPDASYNMISPDYFTNLRIPLLRGRAFSDADTSTSGRVAIVNQTMADLLWPGQNPIGRRFAYESATGPYLTVVGIARKGKYGELLEPPSPYFYEPMTQHYRSLHVLQLRTSVPPLSLAPSIESQARDLDPNLPLFDIQTAEEVISGVNGLFLFHAGVAFAGPLGGLGLLLAVVGLYGVVSFSATQRTHEIGVRMALGAQPGNILSLVLRQALVLIAAGVGIGILAALAVTRLLSSMLVNVSSYDPLTFASVAALLAFVALFACYLPARRAAKLDPSAALRYE
ncbi:MAG: ABC transporter permease [Candidatus Acidiferrales bacterium]